MTIVTSAMKKKVSPAAPRKRKTHVLKLDPAKNINLSAEAQAAYITKGKEKVTSFLGLHLRKSSHDQNDENYFIDLIRKGIPSNVIDEIMKKTGLSENEMADILHISRRTLQRRNPQESLKPEQSEKLIEIAKLYAKGTEVLGDLNAFKEWMESRITTLGGKRPKEFLDTSLGINLLMDELGRIEFGVYS